MIIIPKETQLLYDKNLEDFESLILKIKFDCEKVKHDFLSTNFKNFIRDDNLENKSSFILQFTPYLNYLIYYKNDEDVVNKLKLLGFRSNSLKWLFDLNEIESEIRRLANIDGLLIFPFEYLALSINHISVKFQIEVYESFLDNLFYNGCETNRISVNFRNILRKNNYALLEKSKISNTPYEDLMFDYINKLDNTAMTFDKQNSELFKHLIKLLSGNTMVFTESFLFMNYGISKRRVYSELFPLFKLLLKDLNLKNETEFNENNKESYYNNNYTLYKISKIRDVFKTK